MENQPKKRGGKTRDGINQTPKPFKINNSLLVRMEWVKNFNKFVNQAIEEKLDRIDRQIKEADEID